MVIQAYATDLIYGCKKSPVFTIILMSRGSFKPEIEKSYSLGTDFQSKAESRYAGGLNIVSIPPPVCDPVTLFRRIPFAACEGQQTDS